MTTTQDFIGFLTAQGAQMAPDGSVRRFGAGEGPAFDELSAACFAAPLTDLGIIAVRGDDADTFVQGQLTNDAQAVGPQRAQLNGYCTAKGRLLATFLHWREPDGVYLALARDIQPAVQKRLVMFVLRAKAKLSDASGERVLIGIAGDDAARVRQAFGVEPREAWERAVLPAGGSLLRVPGTARHAHRFIWIAAPEEARAQWEQVSTLFAPAGTPAWRLSEIEAGIAHVTQPTQEQFVPQMVNFELVGGVSFKKGCYPGQEVVARSQYLGKLKRRLFAGEAATDAVPAAGSDVYHSSRGDQPAGLVVQAQPRAPGRVALLFECTMDAAAHGSLHLGGPDGAPIALTPLPYAVPAQAA
jgi:folate-binding protein YgfZ